MLGGLGCVEDAPAFGLSIRLGAEPLPHPAMELDRLAIQSIGIFEAPETHFDGQIEQVGPVGHEARGRQPVQAAELFDVHAPRVALVHDRRVGVAVAEHDSMLPLSSSDSRVRGVGLWRDARSHVARLKKWPNNPLHMLRSVREEQE